MCSGKPLMPDPTVYVEVQMSKYLPFHRRVWSALKFVFGVQSAHWADVIITGGDVELLHALLEAEMEVYK